MIPLPQTHRLEDRDAHPGRDDVLQCGDLIRLIGHKQHARALPDPISDGEERTALRLNVFQRAGVYSRHGVDRAEHLFVARLQERLCGRAIEQQAEFLRWRPSKEPIEVPSVSLAQPVSLPQESGEVGLRIDSPDAILTAALADKRAPALLEVIGIPDFPEQVPARRTGVEGIEDHIAALGVVEALQVSAVWIGNDGAITPA